MLAEPYFEKEFNAPPVVNEEKQPFLNYTTNNNLAQPNQYAPASHPVAAGATAGSALNGQQLLHSSWEDVSRNTNNALANQLNFQTLSVSMDRLDLEMNPPNDRYYIIEFHITLSMSLTHFGT